MNNDLILGISLAGHDSSVSLIDKETGEILYALSEERFSNIKHDGGFPVASIKLIEQQIKLKKLGIIKFVATNMDSKLFLEQIRINLFNELDDDLAGDVLNIISNSFDNVQIFHNEYYPCNYIIALLKKNEIDGKIINFILDKINWYGNFIVRYNNLRTFLQGKFKAAEVCQVPHHMCHAASAYYCSGFNESIALTIDGQGESETITLNHIENNKITTISSTLYPHSLGSLYMHLTWYLGFDGHPKYPGFTDEFKVMGMSAYGKSVYLNEFRKMGGVNEQGEFHINFDEYVELVLVEGCKGHFQPVFTQEFYENFGSRRMPDEPLEQKHYDIALSFQMFIEEIGVKLGQYIKKQYPNVENICLSGGVALNGLMNMEVLRKAGYKNIFIQPASGDDGTSLGAALYTKFNILKEYKNEYIFENVYLGLEYSDKEIESCLNDVGVVYSKPKSIHKEMAKLLHKGCIVTRYFDRAEFGPRALGHRSILANPSTPNMKDIINNKIKHREPFRPFAPACLESEAGKYFDIDCKAPYMLLICKALEGVKDIVPAVVHDDGTARLQTVSESENNDFYQIITEFNELSGIPILVNTSFNVNGETIVETPLDAIESSLFMTVDYLAIGSYLVNIKENRHKLSSINRIDFLERRKSRYIDEYFSNEKFIWTDEVPIESKLDILSRQVSMFRNVADERLGLINTLDQECKRLKSLI